MKTKESIILEEIIAPMTLLMEEKADKLQMFPIFKIALALRASQWQETSHFVIASEAKQSYVY